jgi:ribosomal protein L37AE/L43A
MTDNADKLVREHLAHVNLFSDSDSDSLAIIIAAYYESLPDCPENSPVDHERCGFKVWALDKCDEMLDRMAECLRRSSIGIDREEKQKLEAEVKRIETEKGLIKNFHDLAVKERDYERLLNNRLKAEINRLKEQSND